MAHGQWSKVYGSWSIGQWSQVKSQGSSVYEQGLIGNRQESPISGQGSKVKMKTI